MTAMNEQISYRKAPEPYRQAEVAPSKNPFCPHYSECLEKAVAAGWPQFSCANCRWRDLQLRMMPQPHEIEGHYRLLERIFAPRH
jgi:hypothetical protein